RRGSGSDPHEQPSATADRHGAHRDRADAGRGHRGRVPAPPRSRGRPRQRAARARPLRTRPGSRRRAHALDASGTSRALRALGGLRRAPPPGVRRTAGGWAACAAIPRRAEIDGVQLFYPRYVQVRGMGPWAGVTMAIGAAGIVRQLRHAGRSDVVLAPDILPEGLAAVLPGRWIGVPAACRGRGPDVHGLLRASSMTRGMVRWTLERVAGIGVVAAALGETLNRV